MSETTQTRTTPDVNLPEDPDSRANLLDQMMSIIGNTSESFLGNYLSRDILDRNERHPLFLGPRTTSNRPSDRVRVTPAEHRPYLRPPRGEEPFRTVTTTAATPEPPPLERMITTRRPEPTVRVIDGSIGGLEPSRDRAYIRRPLEADFDGDSMTIRDSSGNRRITIGSLNDEIMSNAVWGPVTSGSLNVGSLTTGSNTMVEQQVIKFLKEKVTLNVSLAQLSAGLELKVSLNLTDTNEQLLSAEDFVKLD